MKALRRFAFALCALAAGSAAAQDAQYPSKPFRVIVPLGAGGLTDIMARLHAAWFNKKYGQTMIVENRPGANGMIAAKAVAKSDPDGYTLLSWSKGTAYASLGNSEARIDTNKTLRGVGAWSVSGLFLLVGNSVPANMKEFVSYVKANP